MRHFDLTGRVIGGYQSHYGYRQEDDEKVRCFYLYRVGDGIHLARQPDKTNPLLKQTGGNTTQNASQTTD